MSRPSFSRAEIFILGFFVLWMLIGFVVIVDRISAGEIEAWPLSPALRSFILVCLRFGDPLSILLAAFNTHCLASRTWGSVVARKWAIIVLVVSAITETIGTLSGWPFGSYQYTDNFGPRVGGILPFAIPFSWYVLVTNLLFVARNLDYLLRWQEALLVGTGVTVIDWIMEPFAVDVKAYWRWNSDSIPWQNYLSWFFLSSFLVWCFAPAPKLQHRNDIRPWIILGAMILLFLSGRYFGRD